MKQVLARGQFATVIALLGFLAQSRPLESADLAIPVTGALLGTVVDSGGTPQMGASVQVFNKYQKLIARTLTPPDGRFVFDGLRPESYSVRVSLDSFLPASRDLVRVRAGFGSILEIHMATLLSTVEVHYVVPRAAMSDDWKWALRSAPGTRPVNRMVDVDLGTNEPRLHPRLFSGTHAVLAMNGGDGGVLETSQSGPDLGTAFAVSTNLLGKNQLQLAGTYGQNMSVGPAAIALCAIYSRTESEPMGTPPEVSLTFMQYGGVSALSNGQPGPPAGLAGILPLRAMTLSVYQTADPLENVHLEYGATGESIEYSQHAMRVSPFARLTTDLGELGEVAVAYSDGARPDPLNAHSRSPKSLETPIEADDLSAPLQSLSRMPQVSNRNGQLALQRTQNYEAGYRHKQGSRTYAVSAFHERVSNGRLGVAGDLAALDSGDLFSDGLSSLSTLNIGRYTRNGILASASQKLSDNVEVSMAYGNMGGFSANGNALGSTDHALLLTDRNRHVANAQLNARVPSSNTRVSLRYGWVEGSAVVPRHLFTTQDIYVTPGLNVMVRQALPYMPALHGRLELTADLRNLLATSYARVGTPSGQSLLLVDAPRAVRGGLSFTF